MGWDFYANPVYDKAYLVREKIEGRDVKPDKVLAHSLRGNHLWRVVEHEDGSRYIALDLMQSGGRNSGWGYKGVSEAMGPMQVDCPLYMLDMVPEPEHNYGWRDKVRAYHADKRSKRVLAAGMEVELAGHRYRLEEPRKSPRGRAAGWYVRRVADGARFCMSAKHAKQASVISTG